MGPFVNDCELIYFMEELLSPDNVFGYAELKVGFKDVVSQESPAANTNMPNMDSGLVGLGSADILQPDTWCGDNTGRRISAIVEDAGLELIPHRSASS